MSDHANITNRIYVWSIWAALLLMPVTLGASLAAGPQKLDRPVMERADENFETCSVGAVSGLNPNGDGFLAVRSGPGTRYRMIDKLSEGDLVWMFDEQGDWIGIVFGSDGIDCPPIAQDRPYAGPGQAGWVHRKFIRMVAG